MIPSRLSTKIKVVGAPEAKRKLKDYCEKKFDDVKDSFVEELEDLAAESVEECPIKTGYMRGSQSLEVSKKEKQLKARLGYGADYAYWVHERLNLNHPQGKAKFLEDPVNRRRNTFIPNIITRTEGK